MGVSREEDGATEDGWGSGERSEDKSERGAGVEVRSQKNQLSPPVSHRKQESEDRRERGGGNGKAEGERQKLRFN